MTNQDFKKGFGKIAKEHGFARAFGGWFKESEQCILVLELQKSDFSNLYYLNIKVYLQGAFPDTYGTSLVMNKDLVKKYMGEILRREPSQFSDAFDMESSLNDEKRLQMIEGLFSDYLDDFSEKALSFAGLRELAAAGEIMILPAVLAELDRLDTVI